MKTHVTISERILLGLEKTVDGYIRVEDFMYNTYSYNRGQDRPLKKSTLAQAIKRLREKGYVDFVDDQKLVIRLTDLGRDKALWAILKQEDHEWDGKWRLVIFDIPEKRRVIRDVFRYQLKLFGFKSLQQSVWISKRSCTEPLRDYVKKVGIKDWVTVVESDNVDFATLF